MQYIDEHNHFRGDRSKERIQPTNKNQENHDQEDEIDNQRLQLGIQQQVQTQDGNNERLNLMSVGTDNGEYLIPFVRSVYVNQELHIKTS